MIGVGKIIGRLLNNYLTNFKIYVILCSNKCFTYWNCYVKNMVNMYTLFNE